MKNGRACVCVGGGADRSQYLQVGAGEDEKVERRISLAALELDTPKENQRAGDEARRGPALIPVQVGVEPDGARLCQGRASRPRPALLFSSLLCVCVCVCDRVCACFWGVTQKVAQEGGTRDWLLACASLCSP